MKNVPSIYSHIIQGFLILFAVLYIFKYWNLVKNLDVYRKLILLLLFAVVIGIHSLSHLGLEYIYQFNPLQWFS